jgi:hypothetical protein
VVLELEADDPVRGTIVGPDEGRQAFYGWLELAAALGRVRLPQAAARKLDQAALLREVPVTPEAGQL